MAEAGDDVGAEATSIDHLLAPLKRGTKDYLLRAIVPSLVQGLTQMAIQRPEDPHVWLADYLLGQSAAGKRLYIAERPADDAGDSKGAEDEAETEDAEGVTVAKAMTVGEFNLVVELHKTDGGGVLVAAIDSVSQKTGVMQLDAVAAKTLPEELTNPDDTLTTDSEAWSVLQSRLRVVATEDALDLMLVD